MSEVSRNDLSSSVSDSSSDDPSFQLSMKMKERRKSGQQKQDEPDNSYAVSFDRDDNFDPQSLDKLASPKKIKIQNNSKDLAKYGCKELKVCLYDIFSRHKDLILNMLSQNSDISNLKPSGDTSPSKILSANHGADKRTSCVEENNENKTHARQENDSNWEEEEPKPEVKRKRGRPRKPQNDSNWKEEPKPKIKRRVGRPRKYEVYSGLDNVDSELENITPLSEYEKMVQKNRNDNRIFLMSLALKEITNESAVSMRSLEPITAKKPKEVFEGPLRKSPRQKKVNVNFPEKILVDDARQAAAVSYKIPTNLTFQEAFLAEEEELKYSDFVTDVSDHAEFKSSKAISNYHSHFEEMKLHESGIVRLATKNLRRIDIHPTRNKIFIAAAVRCGNIVFWIENTESKSYTFHPHSAGISHLKFNPEDPVQLLSSSSDGTVQCADLCKEVFTEVFNGSHRCRYFDFLSPTAFVLGLSIGDVSVVDMRSENKSWKTHKCHEYGLETVSVHPTNKNYFITTSIYGPVNLWDLRNLRKRPVAQEKLRHFTPGERVSMFKYINTSYYTSAIYSPIGTSILVTTDSSISILDKNLECKKIKPYSNFTRALKATWLPNSEDNFAIGNVRKIGLPKGVSIFDINIRKKIEFTDVNISCNVISYVFHPCLPVLTLTGSTAGTLYVFKKVL